MIRHEQQREGFTIVELLIVIVIIAILATITIIAYNGIQVRARDSRRLQDMDLIVKGLEIYRT
jgi:prepilin-type N-terminal cleavage/methylation domain-containing protein